MQERPVFSVESEPSTLQWNRHLLGLLCYVPGAGLLVLGLERKNRLIRFHAVQALLFLVLLMIFNLLLSLASATAHRITWFLGVKVDAVVVWIYWVEACLAVGLLYKGYRLKRFRLPWVADVAQSLVVKCRLWW